MIADFRWLIGGFDGGNGIEHQVKWACEIVKVRKKVERGREVGCLERQAK